MRGRIRILAAGLGLLLLPAPGLAESSPTPRVRLLVSDPAPYAGEAVELTLEVRHPGRPGNAMSLQWPVLDDFASDDPSFPPPGRDLGEGQALVVERAVRTIRPLREGRLRLTGAGLRVDGRLVPAPPLLLRVRPLPLRNRPPAFAGGVGRVELDVVAPGEGAREIQVLLRGRGLAGFPPPQVAAGANERLSPLPPPEGGPPPDELRTFRYWYDPDPGRRGQLVATLSVFDPETATYRVLEAGPGKSREPGRLLPHAAGLLAILALFCAGFLALRLRPADLDRELARVLGAPPRGMSRCQVLAGLTRAGVPEDLREDYRRLEREREKGFAPDAPETRTEAEDAPVRSRLARRLRNHVDKSRGIS